MFESLGRGWKMIMASIRMGFEDTRLLYPSLATVFVNFFFGLLLIGDGAKVAGGGTETGKHVLRSSHNLIQNLSSGQIPHAGSVSGLMDQSGMGSIFGNINGDVCWSAAALFAIWWLINRFLEGLTTALVYSHLTEGPGSGKFSIASKAVFESLPALIWLGLATFLANRFAKFLKDKGTGTSMGFGLGFLAGIVQVFWTLAGHLILPAIVIEGCTFMAALKRADKIASGNLLTIGFGEVGIDKAGDFIMFLIGALGVAGFGYAYAAGMLISMPCLAAGFVWVCLVCITTAAFMYIRSAFYTCLYVWAIEAATVSEMERRKVAPPAPLAAALA